MDQAQMYDKKAFPFDLMPNEKVLWEGVSSRIAFIPIIFMLLCFLAIDVAFVYVAFFKEKPPVSVVGDQKTLEKPSVLQPGVSDIQCESAKKEEIKKEPKSDLEFFLLMGALFSTPFLLLMIGNFRRFFFSKYLLTSERISIYSRFLSSETIILDIDKVLSVRKVKGVLGILSHTHVLYLSYAPISNSAFSSYGIYVSDTNDILAPILNQWLLRDNKTKFL